MPKIICYSSIQVPDSAAMLSIVEHGLLDHDLAPSKNTDGEISCQTEYGLMHFVANTDALKINLCADNETRLFVLRESIEAHLAPFLENTSLEWQGQTYQGEHPPHFRKATITEMSHVTPNFIRLRATGKSLEIYAKGGLHFRLLLPPEGRTPVWPSLSEKGQTIWPKGDDSLHMPVYTVANIDPKGQWLDFDVFLHGKGKTCKWAENAIGQKIGLIGPGGGEILEAKTILLAGDETAIPAMVRILTAIKPDQSVKVVVQASDTNDSKYVQDLVGQNIQYVSVNSQTDLLNSAKSYLDELDTLPYVWYSAEKKTARSLRSYLKERNHDLENMHVTAYWTDT